MTIDAGRLKHLELIQQVITRMANNSFLVKGWSITLIVAILAIAKKNELCEMARLAFVPLVMFWILDGFFLRQERLYRALWDAVRAQDQDAPTDFSMDTRKYESGVVSWSGALFTRTLTVFHGALLAILLATVYFLCGVVH